MQLRSGTLSFLALKEQLCCLFVMYDFIWREGLLWTGFPGGSDGKECNAGDRGLLPGLGRSSGEGMATHSSILAWGISWAGKPGGLQSIGWQEVRHN